MPFNIAPRVASHAKALFRRFHTDARRRISLLAADGAAMQYAAESDDDIDALLISFCHILLDSACYRRPPFYFTSRRRLRQFRAAERSVEG